MSFGIYVFFISSAEAGIDILVNLNRLLPLYHSVKNPKRLYSSLKIHSTQASAIEDRIETLNVYRSKVDYSRPNPPLRTLSRLHVKILFTF